MIIIKTGREIELMRRAGRITARAIELLAGNIREGITTRELDQIARDYILSQGARPSFLGYGGYPASTCISVNEEVIHGIPSHRRLLPGDVVSVDIGVFLDGYHADSAATFAVGRVSGEAERLIEVTRKALSIGIEAARDGGRIGDIGAAVQGYVEGNGFSVVRKYVGHGVGAELHEDPNVPNYGVPGRGARLSRGMTLAIEPMVNQGAPDVTVLSDGWTVVTSDGKLSAHFEHTIAITDGYPDVLTLP